MRPAYLSASQINTYLLCPAKYQLRYIDGAEPAFKPAALALGSAVHAAIEWIHRERIAGHEVDADTALAILDADLHAQGLGAIRYRAGQDQDALVASGHALIGQFLANLGEIAPASVEVPFSFELVHRITGEVLDVPLRGYLDVVEENGAVVELKTAARAPEQSSLAHMVQLSIYSIAGLELFGSRPSLRLVTLTKTKVPRFVDTPVERGPSDDVRLFVLASQVLAAIEAHSFFPSPGWQCTDCEFRQQCPFWSNT